MVCTVLRIQEVLLSNSCIEIVFLSDGFRSFAQSLRENSAIVLRRVTSIGYFQAFLSALFVFIL